MHIRIKEMLKCLPEEDQQLGKRLLDNRSFELLYNLINSIIHKYEQLCKTIDKDYKVVIKNKIADLQVLRSEIDNYMLLYEEY